MGIDIQRQGAIATARLSGALIAANADAVKAALADVAFQPDARVVVDLSKLDQIDSSGLSVLIHTVTRSRMTAGRVILLNPTPFVSGIFNVTRLDRYFEIFQSPAEAQDALLKD